MENICAFKYEGSMDFTTMKQIDTIDISDLKGIYTMCDEKNLEIIQSRLNKLENKKVFLLGNGNFHYLTFPIFENFSKKASLIVFDHHHDGGILPYEGLVSCGSWIKNLVEQDSNVDKVYIIGASKKLLDNVFEDEKIILLCEEDFTREKFAKLVSEIEANNIYVSIDRDILSKEVLETNWDQGIFSLEDLLYCISYIREEKNIFAMDICGDKSWMWNEMKSKEYINSLENVKSLVGEAGFFIEI